MRYLWSRLLIMLLAIEGALFVLYYNFGPRGIRVLQQLKLMKLATEQEVESLLHNNQKLQDSIDEWKHDLFLSEKFAREKLAMQKEGEVIYFKTTGETKKKQKL